ncbi:uncharacterized protein LOC117169790 [Belonocnema kinseyi]|uniref:uncharacterized protein LOC117169790 n=1 Tax=Belonocnema kinseyi TaxID=2817044 RepID=UPI00143D9E4F|nr:uncharacterized protein LOC117169790 [Belonocnema kinseyi]
MTEYKDLGHMTEDPNASKKSETSTGISINDTLMVGPSIQEDLFSLLIRFRSHAYAMTADIEKMYREIYIHPDDHKFQKILWRENPSQPVKMFTSNTVTYGNSSASFLATRLLVQLANDEGELFPNASVALKEDFYMDDLLTGANTFDEAESLINELKAVTRKGGMHLRQWASNDPELINTVSDDTKNSHLQWASNDPELINTVSDDTKNSHLFLNLGETTITLGVYWNPQLDIFKYTVHSPKVVALVTKRIILSQIAQLFDPLGLLGPVILRAKILMQSLWDSKLDWDDPVPEEIHVAWLEY